MWKTANLLVLGSISSKERMRHVFELNQNRLYPRWMKRFLNDSNLGPPKYETHPDFGIQGSLVCMTHCYAPLGLDVSLMFQAF